MDLNTGTDLTFASVDRSRLADFEALFEAPGGPKYCWCMAWREMPADARQRDGTARKAAMLARVRRDEPVGLLGYQAGTPVAWVSIAPRSSYRPLGGPEAAPGESIWSLACMYVLRRLRGTGMAYRLIGAAVDHARAQGATVVEAYPVAADSPSYRFMGFVPAFERLAFEHCGMAGSRRHVMRLRL